MATFNYYADSLTSTPYSNSTYLDDYWTADVYQFNLNDTASINANLHNITEGDDADLTLYRDSDNNGQFDPSIDEYLITSNNGGNSDDSLNYRAEAGTYFAQVNYYSFGSDGRLDYELDLSATPIFPGSNEAPNLLPIEADGGTLSRGDVLTEYGWVGDTNTSDIYKFILNSYGTINIDLTELSSDADLRVIWDLNENNIVDSDDFIGAFTSTNGSNLSENLSFGLYPNVPFYVQVYQYSGDTNYQLEVSVV